MLGCESIVMMANVLLWYCGRGLLKVRGVWTMKSIIISSENDKKIGILLDCPQCHSVITKVSVAVGAKQVLKRKKMHMILFSQDIPLKLLTKSTRSKFYWNDKHRCIQSAID